MILRGNGNATPETPSISPQSAIFRRRLHQILDVPVGLIDNACGSPVRHGFRATAQ